MKYSILRIFISILLTLLLCYPGVAALQSTSSIQHSPLITEGQILYAPVYGTTTYLVNSDGTMNHTWSSVYFPGVSVYWLGDDTILRTIRVGVGPGVGGAGGGIQKVLSNGTVAWDFRYDTNGCLSHHDIKVLPNGNVLMIAWETKTKSEATAAGRNPSYTGNGGLMPDHIIEVQPTGPTSGAIVWEWHAWDHLIQDYDASKANYGVVGDHPELIDINFLTSTQMDWMHTNSIDYNPVLDQILLNIPTYGEIWVIDHGTTTEEAAGHSGGHYGHGGDLLYRWGNPAAYRAGTSSDAKLFNEHDASWIKPGLPGAGDILIFNNGAGRPGSQYSSIDELTPPIDEDGHYSLEPGSAYGPTILTWTYTANPPTNFYAAHLSGAQRLANGNTLICNGETGEFFEVTSAGSTVWQYSSSMSVYKIVYIPPGGGINGPDLDCSGSLAWTKVKPGDTVTGSFTIQNIGTSGSMLNWTVDTSLLTWGNWTLTPSSGRGLTPENGSVTIHVSVIAPQKKDQTWQGYLKVVNQNNSYDFDTIPVSLTTPTTYQISHFSGLFAALRTFFSGLYQLWLHHCMSHRDWGHDFRR